MPEQAEMPAEPAVPPKRNTAAAAAKIEELKKKYRLDKEVNLYARGPDGTRLGRGAVLDQQVFDKFASLDHTRNKRYLDWMLFQAGGGVEAFKKSQDNWGDGYEETPPENFFKKFETEKPEHVVHYDELKSVVQKLKDKGLDFPKILNISDEVEAITKIPDRVRRWNKLVELLKATGVAPEREERVAVEIIANKFKVWIKNQFSTKTRDRVHATSVYSRLTRGMNRKLAEEKWKAMEPRRRYEYVFGDQDSLKWEAFGFNRHWPGRANIYETVYNEMRQFLLNKERVESYDKRLEAYNDAIEQKNKNLPPGQQLPFRHGFQIDLNIGKVITDAEGNLTYSGPYPGVYNLAEANKEIADLPMRERVTHDVQYAGPKGMRSKTAKVYSDENLDVSVPLTVAAAIQAGHPSWPVSDPEQIRNLKSQGSYSASTWTKYAAGKHEHPEWRDTPAIQVFFHLKVSGIPEDLKRIWLVVFLGDLVDLQPPYVATIWRVAGNKNKFTFNQLMQHIKSSLAHDGQAQKAYVSIVRSIGNAMKALREWGKEFNPQDIVADYIAHHREKMQGKRTFEEEVKLRAYQVVQALLE